MSKIIKIFILSMLVVSLAGCSLPWQKKTDTKGQDVILARDCGLDHLKCCAEDPPCSYHQKCCSDPKDPNRNYCASECTCGGERDFCCDGKDKCKNGLSCYEGVCLKCGKKEEVCCGSKKECNPGFGCQNDFCTECGLVNHPCCRYNFQCEGQDKLDEKRTECISNTCTYCGHSGYPSCSKDPKCLRGTLYNNDTCFSCGKNNQPCCNSSAGTGYECDPKEGLKCNRGFCD